ncbi:MAG: hypothetical protein IH840_08125 [Candidatus Heimdallarchaeota archaeon]|nr:hypothetical protein [Candidatus Heimdallarchaeota archaeon]
MTTNDPPPGCVIFAMAYDKESKLSVIYGGLNSTLDFTNQQQARDDTWSFDFAEATWEEVQVLANTSALNSKEADSDYVLPIIAYPILILFYLKKKNLTHRFVN